MDAILYGVGVGPGDPELMTIKAVKTILENEIIALPAENPKQAVSYKIAEKAVPEISQKTLISVYMPMTHNREEMAKNHIKGAKAIEKYLKEGKNVVFLTLGDPSVYSTFSYIQEIVKKDGYKTQMISGVPSFCAAAAKADTPLSVWNEPLYIIPAVHSVKESLDSNGTYIFMKSGSKMGKIKEVLSLSDRTGIAIENCGMENERVYFSLDEMPDKSGYYSLIISKKENND